MDIFINSTFAQSMQGYRLMRMGDDAFGDIRSVDELLPQVYSFFSEDLFKGVWCETADEKDLFFPRPTGSYLGLKGFSGLFDNQKKGVVNIVFCAAADEIFMLAMLAKKILGNYSGFSNLIFKSFHVDAAGNYFGDKQAFLRAVQELPSDEFPEFVANTGFACRTARDLLHFAVCVGSPERALDQLPGRRLRLRPPKCMLGESDFDAYIASK